MSGSVRPVAAARQQHVSRHRLLGAHIRHKHGCLHRYRLQCSQSTGEWQAASDGDWGSKVSGQNADAKSKRTIWATLLLAIGLAIAFILTRLSLAGKPLESAAQQQNGLGPPTQSIVRGNTATANQNQAGASQVSDSAVHAPSGPGQASTASRSTTAASGAQGGADEADGVKGATDDLHLKQTGAGVGYESTVTDETQEPLLQHLFEDLKHRPPMKSLALANDNVQFEETASIAFNSKGADTRGAEEAKGSSTEAQAPAAPVEEPTDDLVVQHSEIDELGGLAGHDELQQRAALAVRAAHAALRACESASAHSAASCRAASEAASAANSATHAASQALASAERGASEDLERALRRVQHAQQQARDAEAAAATAATNANAKAATATEQEKLAQKAASPQLEQASERENVGDKVKAAALRSQATIQAWLTAFCTWCANAWQAFLAWTSRMGEYVQRLISRRQ